MSLPIALQLYSVRDELSKDFKKTIEAVKKMGYQAVELSGLNEGDDPREIKKILDDNGLLVLSSHVPFFEILNGGSRLFDNYKLAGCDYIVIPWLDKNTAFTKENFNTTLKNIEKAGKMAQENGITLLYHNHNFEFEKINGEYILDIIYSTISPEYLETQLDTCWVKVGGEDPADYLMKYKGRAPLVHLKDFSGFGKNGLFKLIGNADEEGEKDGDFCFRPLGMGVQDIKAIAKAAEDAGAKMLIVEQDESPDMPTLEAAKLSREYLSGIGY